MEVYLGVLYIERLGPATILHNTIYNYIKHFHQPHYIHTSVSGISTGFAASIEKPRPFLTGVIY